MHIKITKKIETKIKKTRKALDQAGTIELKNKNIKITAYKKLKKQLYKKLKFYLKAQPALANILKGCCRVIYRYNQKTVFYRL